MREGESIFGTDSLDWLGVPLKARDRTIGVLAVQSYSGTVRYAESDKALLQFVSDQVAAAIERKRAETALKQSQERLQRALEASRLALWDYDIENGRMYLSEAWSELLGGPCVPTVTDVREPARDRASGGPAGDLGGAAAGARRSMHPQYRLEHRVIAPGRQDDLAALAGPRHRARRERARAAGGRHEPRHHRAQARGGGAAARRARLPAQQRGDDGVRRRRPHHRHQPRVHGADRVRGRTR